MRYFLISDSHDALVGFRLAGVDGVMVRKRDEVLGAIRRVLGDPDIGILLINERCAALCAGELDDLKLNRSIPLVVEIPDRHGTRRASDSITRYIQESIGIKI